MLTNFCGVVKSICKHIIRSRCTKVKQGPYHRTIKSSIKWNTGKVLIKISLGRHGCLAWLGIFHTKLHEHVLHILCLGDECSLSEFLDLKAKEILQAPHHGHLKILGHSLREPLAQRFIRTTKYYVIYIELAYGQPTTASLDKKSSINDSPHKSFLE